MDLANRSCPLQFQIALALSVVKSKPQDTSIRDHILNLRNHIAAGKRRRPEPACLESHLDSTKFWREAYEKSEAAQSKLLDRIYELEQRNEARLLRDKWDASITAQEQSVARSKPKPLSSARPKKRAKTVNVESQAYALPSTKIRPNHHFSNLEFCEGITAQLMRRSHTLQTLLRKKTNPEAIALAIESVCRTVETALLTAVQEEIAQRPPAKGSRQIAKFPIQDISKFLDVIFPSILQGLSRTSSLHDAGINTKSIVYHIARLFQRIMQQSYQYALLKASPEGTYEKSPAQSREKPKARSNKKKKKPCIKPAPKVENILGCFANMACTMFGSLDTAKPEHRDLLEGFTFVILEHVGMVLGFFTFKDLSPLTEPTTLNLKLAIPAYLTTAYNDIKAPAPDIAEIAAVWNSKHLIQLLKLAILFMDQHQKVDEVAAESIDCGREEGLASNAKTKLQNTLLKGVFGADDISLGDSLNFPPETPSGIACPEPSINPQESPGEWFTQEVWTILGWDSLLKCQCLARK
ncbi:hypothetical protein GTR04_2876 [Trichophyton interdigitale]|uniref:Uncharacterized protein n=1 Tax=Trichophyton interdigitale TaxID=101480 RepID=A0A9P5CZQ4_9EURO|nr:hypothetical protein H101_01209 [Trichophyton interdigitale H6]KAF3895635.1 hypothetical protein GY631_2491 [Trichophyton interdigitale]KAF3899839.1 hypothetical protein GY632_1097 [Trichophyton interdigitale]KAG8209723.1 hypothetical protein GTR04_2876 [Trichophyton interdigitale]